MGNRFIIPANMDELCVDLKEKDDNTFIIAGGTDLTIKFKKEGIFDFNIISIGKLKELSDIEINDDTIMIGSCVTMTEIGNNEGFKKHIPALVDAAINVGSTQIRNKATIGGNIANAAQCGDTIPVLYAYDAKLKILNSLKEYRYENIRDFILGINKTTLKSDEIIVGVEIKRTNLIASFSKIGSRKTVTIAKLNCCGIFDIDENDFIKDVDIYMGAIGIKPVKADLIENILIGEKLGKIGQESEEAIKNQIEKAIPDRSSRHYKKTAAIGLIEDMLENLRR